VCHPALEEPAPAKAGGIPWNKECFDGTVWVPSLKLVPAKAGIWRNGEGVWFPFEATFYSISLEIPAFAGMTPLRGRFKPTRPL